MPFWWLLLPLLLALLGVTACSPFPGPPGTPHATPLAAAFPARIVLPPCLADDGLPDAAQGFTLDIPKNMGRLLGFELYVPTGLPADVTWNGPCSLRARGEAEEGYRSASPRPQSVWGPC